MNKEIERKFLVKCLPDLRNVESFKIEQSYVSINPEIRIRRENDKYFYTKKGEGTLSRIEKNTIIDVSTYNNLKNKIKGNTIYKTRYKLPLDELVAELDIYEDYLEGLMVVEVEFSSLAEAYIFSAPYYFGEDITEDKRFKNKYLSQIDALEELNIKTLKKMC